MKFFQKIGMAMAFSIVFFNSMLVTTTAEAQSPYAYTLPQWAPSYSPGVRYYYFPDIEVYYDLANRSYAYLDNEQWFFSYELPPFYNNYDLYNGFVIALNNNVFEPWRHHQFYVSNYPRYYYHNVYRDIDRPNIRGFNENINRPFYFQHGERERMAEYRERDRAEFARRNEHHEERHIDAPREPQRPNYYGKNIGQPVPVHANMREDHRDNVQRDAHRDIRDKGERH